MIGVEKAQKRVSTADVLVKKTKILLADAIKKYGANSVEAKIKTQELDNAEKQLSINTQLLTERTEDHQRAQENFWIGLIPTVTSAGGTVVSVIKEMIGAKGFGGLASAITSATTAIGVGGKGKGGGGGAGLLGALGAIGGGTIAGITGGVAGAGLILGQAESARGQAAASGLFADPLKDYNKNLAQTKIFMDATNASGLEMLFNFESLKQKFLQTNPVLDATGQIIVDVGNKVQEQTPKVNENKSAWETQMDMLKEDDATTKTLTATIETSIPTIEKQSTAVFGMAANIKLLDSNLQPLPATAQQLVDVLGQAEASLAASGSGLNYFVGLNKTATATLAEFKQQVDQNIATDNVFRKGLTADITELTGVELSSAFTTEQLKLLYAAAAESKTKFDALFATLRKGNPALWETGAAAAVTMTNLIPTSKTLSGPRNPNYRLRSDYQTPLIGSAFSQRQQLAGTRGPGKTHIKTNEAQFGMHEFLTEPTGILAHPGERVDIDKPGRGGGGFPRNVIIQIGEASFKAYIRNAVGEDQGTWR